METQPDEEKRRAEIDKMFNIAEKIVMEYICQYIKKTPTDVFKNTDGLDMKKEDLVLFPLEDYDAEHYISFGLEMVACDHQTVIPEALVDNVYIKESINFLQYTVNEVFMAIIHSNLVDEIAHEVFEKSIHFEYDEKSLTFYPRYIFPNRRQIDILSKYKTDLGDAKSEKDGQVPWDSLADETKEEWQKKMDQITGLLENISFDEETAAETEERVNKDLMTHTRIGIIYKELLLDELPAELQSVCREKLQPDVPTAEDQSAQ